MNASHNTQVSKKPKDFSKNSDLLEKSRALNINLSATLEHPLTEQLRAEQRAQWLRENADAIQAYNQFVEANGTFSDNIRRF